MAKQITYRKLFFKRYMLQLAGFIGWPGYSIVSLSITARKLQVILLLIGITIMTQDMAPQIQGLRKIHKQAKRKKSNKRARSK